MFDRGGLVLVPFPFTDQSATKRRPVLALTAPDPYGDFVALPVTSRGKQENLLPLSSSDLVLGMLPLASWVRTDRVVTLNAALVVKSFGQVSDSFRIKALDALCRHVGHGMS